MPRAGAPETAPRRGGRWGLGAADKRTKKTRKRRTRECKARGQQWRLRSERCRHRSARESLSAKWIFCPSWKVQRSNRLKQLSKSFRQAASLSPVQLNHVEI